MNKGSAMDRNLEPRANIHKLLELNINSTEKNNINSNKEGCGTLERNLWRLVCVKVKEKKLKNLSAIEKGEETRGSWKSIFTGHEVRAVSLVDNQQINIKNRYSAPSTFNLYQN